MQALAGIRVLDASHVVSGPLCAWLLAALGAEVIRVEPPGGDLTWRTLPFVGPDGVHRGPRRARDIAISPLRRARGKRSVVLDLKREEARAVFRKLAARCDVLVENSVPGAMERLGLDYASLAPTCPRLVYCSITGYGYEGPYRDRPSMDLVVQAVSGLMAKTGFPDGPPTKVGATVGDQVPAVYAALGVLAALRQRERDGRGQRVDIAMLDSLLSLLWDEPIDVFEEQGLPDRVGNGDPRGAPIDVFRSTDGWVALLVPHDAQWRALCDLMGRPELAARWPDHGARLAARDEVNASVAAWCLTQTSDAAAEQLLALGIPAGPVRSPYAARRDPHVAARGALVPLRHPDLAEPTRFLGPALPIRFSRAESATAPAEPLGASSEAVLRELCELDDAEIAKLRASGALG
ncbi:MAG TPA: CoA transferase [Myxococcota bacterium]|jgi:crotonobetainyl-CoA:carnitine CoA-transferase CaiB-like acyl-CoA transferase|nr:CoA transferase [Myxococcota bacterium]